MHRFTASQRSVPAPEGHSRGDTSGERASAAIDVRVMGSAELFLAAGLPNRLDERRLIMHFWPEIIARRIMPVDKHSWSLQDAKNRFSEVVNAARREPQTVTKHGRPAVVVLDAAAYERLRRLERAQAPSFADLLLGIPQDDGEFPRRAVRMRDLQV